MTTPNRGFALLLSVMILGAVGIVISTSLTLSSIHATHSARVTAQREQARALADACIEAGLQRLAANSSASGSQAITLGKGSCTNTIARTASSVRVQGVATVGPVTKKVSVSLDSASMEITSWKDVADFN